MATGGDDKGWTFDAFDTGTLREFYRYKELDISWYKLRGALITADAMRLCVLKISQVLQEVEEVAALPINASLF